MPDKACKDCKRIVEEGNECPVCKNNDLSTNFSGQVVIYEPENSEIAEELGIQTPGKYAIRVK